ncbi:ester cyclase [Spirosoma sp. BT702]|uniref:Ester cyclase n=1 Tax=Spirosoma profusum TaxID=2771354 RepID=A0A927GAU7_9BACT|nr:ester cyclase [Spirosoma profusum]MBD2705415.1 ester cyclase [Spirosoma profusum]
MKTNTLFIPLMFCFFQISYAQTPVNNKQVVRQYIDEVVNKQQFNRMDDVFSTDYIWHQMDGKDTHSRQDSSHVVMLKYILKAIPDIQYTIDSMVSEGDLVAVNSTATGRIKNGFMGIPATGKKVRFKQMFFFRVVNNKIAEEWEVVDVAGLKDQLSK